MIKKNIATNDMGFVFNPSTGDSFSSNLIAAEIINLLKANHSEAQILTILLEKYDVDKNTLKQDIDDFILQLQRNGLTH